MEDIANTQNPDPALINTLLVLNPKTNKIEVVKTVDEKGDLKTVSNTRKNQNQFLKIDKQGDLFSNFFPISSASSKTLLHLIFLPLLSKNLKKLENRLSITSSIQAVKVKNF